MWTWQRLTAACWMLRCSLRRRMRAAHRSCVLCEHQTCRFRGAVVARRVRDSTDCLHALVPFFVRRLEHCACESALSARPLAVACGTCICNHTRSQRQPPSSQGGWQSLAERVCVWGPVVSPLTLAQLNGRPCLLSGAHASLHGPIDSRWDMLQRSVS